MFDERIYEWLKSNDVDERKRAVKALAQTEHNDALPILARLYKQDPDQDVREMALRAGRYIKKQAHAAKWEQGGVDEAEYVDVSDENQRMSKRNLDKALEANLIGEGDKAVTLLKQAFKLNPNLQHDRDARRRAAEILGIKSEQEAVDTIMDEIG